MMPPEPISNGDNSCNLTQHIRKRPGDRTIK